MAITFVNSTSGSATNGNNVTLTLSGLGIQQGDLVILFGGASRSEANDATGTYTEVYRVTTLCPLYVGYKFMGATPDTSATGSGSGTGTDSAAYGAIVLRGVDSTTPQDATATTASSTDPPSITTTTDGAWVVDVVSVATRDTAPGTNDGSNTVATNGNDSNDITIAASTYAVAAAGTLDPGAWSSLTSTSPHAVTTAWRPDLPTLVDAAQTSETEVAQASGRVKAKTIGRAW